MSTLSRVAFCPPVHLNPHVHTVAHQEFAQHPQVHLLSPLDYPDLLAILQASYLIMTDSGGIQEESPTYQNQFLFYGMSLNVQK